MYKVLKGWIDQHLSDEEAVLFTAILALSIVIIVTMGAVLGPLFAGIVFAYVMQGVIKTLARYQIPNAIAVMLTFLVFLGGFIGFLFLIIPRVWRQLRALFAELPEMVNKSQSVLEKLPEKVLITPIWSRFTCPWAALFFREKFSVAADAGLKNALPN